MDSFRLSFNSKFIIALVAFFLLYFTKVKAYTHVFNLKDYGVVQGGKYDINKALQKAWNDACKAHGHAQLVVPYGTYLVKPMELTGPCRGPIEFLNKGTLKAPLGLHGIEHWIAFQYIDGLTIDGGGLFDGSGPPKQAAPGLPALLKFNFVTNSTVRNVRLENSLSTHLHLFACNNTDITKISISSPGDSPNTDGIKMGIARGITISDTTIASGDDCVAILAGSNNITVSRVKCGPGHGISIGSIGGSPNEIVRHINVLNCSFTNTMNGVRIKAKATKNPGLVSHVHFQDLIMTGADNPIIIEQNYCPSQTCGQGDSKVKIQNITYSNIRGTSKVKEAVNIKCSQSNPCENIEMKDIILKLKGNKGFTFANCSYVKGRALGTQIPKCI